MRTRWFNIEGVEDLNIEYCKGPKGEKKRSPPLQPLGRNGSMHNLSDDHKDDSDIEDKSSWTHNKSFPAFLVKSVGSTSPLEKCCEMRKLDNMSYHIQFNLIKKTLSGQGIEITPYGVSLKLLYGEDRTRRIFHDFPSSSIIDFESLLCRVNQKHKEIINQASCRASAHMEFCCGGDG
ncbi:hypothetical protein Tco_0189179 [Tanacetum coccineum]